ncbi:MAG: metal-dependent transcriptional regulator [Planctomycetota bacterium]|nr:metal-dependent transcriptional regulator [Planctomycetota bacterium]MDI6787259.1 metal-dependent transcriptional regulator [Planctomycetota bacterium]
MKKRKEEILELAWVGKEKGTFSRVDIEKSTDERVSVELLDELIKDGYLRETDGLIELTDKGEVEARRIIRSHRLSERLLADILDIKPQTMEQLACTFEHFLNEEVVDSICTILGHPKECPHGQPIPPGKCCEKALKEISSIVIPLTDIKVGSEARVSYVATKHHQRLHQLLSFGLIPGAIIRIHQTIPSYVLKIGQTDIAIDEEVAKDIYVRLKTM